MDNLDLFQARRTDPSTSHEAAAKRSEQAGKYVQIIAHDMTRHGPSTYREVADRTGVVGTTTSTVMSKMEREGLLVRTGERRNGCMVRRINV